jgi:hypothetical protein
LAIQGALMGFLVDEVVNPQGKDYYDSHPIDLLTSEEDILSIKQYILSYYKLSSKENENYN